MGGDFFSISIMVVEGPNGDFWSAEGEQAQNYLTQLVLHTGDLKKEKTEQKIIIFRLSVCRSDSLSKTAKKKNYSSLKLQHDYLGYARALADLDTSH